MSDERRTHSQFSRIAVQCLELPARNAVVGPVRRTRTLTTPQEGPEMRKIVLSLTAVSALVVGAAIAPAQAMTVGTAAGMQAAIDNASMVEDAAYVCRHRYWSSRRVCWWRPNYRYRGWRGRRW